MKDVVCGMDVDVNRLKKDFNGKVYYFCSPSCMQAFEKNPQKFVK